MSSEDQMAGNSMTGDESQGPRARAMGEGESRDLRLGEHRPRIAGRISAYFGESRAAVSDIAEGEVDYVPSGLLGELDVQQDDVIRRLDELNLKIERLMRQWQPALDDDVPGRSETDTEAA